MKKKKKAMKEKTNLYAIFSLLVFLLGFIVGGNLIFVLLILIISSILAIMGIVKAKKDKTSKALSIIILSISSLFLVVFPAYNLIKHAYNYNKQVSYSALTEKEKVVFDAVSDLYVDNGLNKTKIKIESIYYQATSEENSKNDVYINYITRRDNKKHCYNAAEISFNSKEYDYFITDGEKMDSDRIVGAFERLYLR